MRPAVPPRKVVGPDRGTGRRRQPDVRDHVATPSRSSTSSSLAASGTAVRRRHDHPCRHGPRRRPSQGRRPRRCRWTTGRIAARAPIRGTRHRCAPAAAERRVLGACHVEVGVHDHRVRRRGTAPSLDLDVMPTSGQRTRPARRGRDRPMAHRRPPGPDREMAAAAGDESTVTRSPTCERAPRCQARGRPDERDAGAERSSTMLVERARSTAEPEHRADVAPGRRRGLDR